MTANTPCPVCKHDDCHWPGRDSLVARLRYGSARGHPGELLHEAADLIEQLQRERDIAGGKFADERRHYIAANARAEAAEARLALIEQAADAMRAWVEREGYDLRKVDDAIRAAKD